MSSDKRSRTAFLYSVRFRRRSVSVRPGSGFRAHAVSSDVSSQVSSARRSSGDCCGMLGGGIVPVRTLCTTFSQSAGLPPGAVTSTLSSTRFAVFTRSLTHVMQYRSMTGFATEASSADARRGAACCAVVSVCKPRATTRANPPSPRVRFFMPLLRENIFDDVSLLYARELPIQALIPLRQPLVIDPEAIHDRRLQVSDVNRISHNIVREIVRFPIHNSALDTGSGHPHGEAPGVMVPAIIFGRQPAL